MGTFPRADDTERRPRMGEADLWQVQLGSPGLDRLIARAHAVLTDEERERGGRIRAGMPREEFLAARGLLRLLLGSLTGRPASELVFENGAQGKPSLLESGGLEFNVAHTRGRILLAVSRDGAVGVDVEAINREVEVAEIATANFHPQETAEILAEPDEMRRTATFFRCWTRKEAVVKADGRGLQLPLQQFCVSGQADLTELCVPLPGASALWVRTIELGADYFGAFAARRPGLTLQLHALNTILTSPDP